MADFQEITLVSTNTNAQAIDALQGATGSDPTYTIEDLLNEIRTGAATLYQVIHGRTLLGFVVLWIEDFGGTKELVIQAGAALAREGEAVRLTIPALERFARARGCASMRAHVSDRRLQGRLKRSGFNEAEIVMRKAW